MTRKGDRPGWYPNPDGPGQRWWNGLSWSDAYRSDAGRPMSPTAAGVTGPIIHRGQARVPARSGAGAVVHPGRAQGQGRRRSGGAASLIIVLLIVGSLGLSLWLWDVRSGFAVPDGYVTTTGVVDRAETRGNTCHDVVAYTAAGAEYTVTDDLGAPSCTPLGLGVDVAYDPADPARAMIPHPTGETILTVLAALPLIAAVLLGLLLLKLARRHA